MTRAPARPLPITADLDSPGIRPLLERAVEEAARLLNADGAMVYLVDAENEVMRFAVDAGIRDPEAQRLIRDLTLPVGVGLFGHTAGTGEVVVSGDYRNDERFPHSPIADRIVQTANMRSMAAAPLIAEGQVLGALGAYSSRTDDFDEAEVALLRALADHAATAIANERLIGRLASAKEELARRVEAQRTLGRITAAIATIRDPDAVLREIVSAAQRLLGSDGAHLTLMDPKDDLLRPTVVVGGNAAWTEDWFRQLEFPVNEGINGLAAGTCDVVWTEDYLIDPRIPHEESDQDVAGRLQLRGMASAPLPGGEGSVMGTLAVSFADPHVFTDDELELLRGLADQGAVAIANARLLDRLTSSEARFRHLVTSSPDLVWETDADGRFTFLSPRLTELTGWKPEEMVGKPWPSIVSADSMVDAEATWVGLQADPSVVRKNRFMLLRREGEPIPAEVYAIGSASDGVFTGAHGSIRDLTEAEALTHRLQQQADELERRVDAQRTLATMAAQLTSLRDPSQVLKETLIAAVRLLKGNGGQIGMIAADDEGILRWGDGHSFAHGELTPFTKEDQTPVDEGVSGRAVRTRRTTWTTDYLTDTSFPHEANADRIAGELGIRAVIASPLLADGEPIGAIGVFSESPGAFDADDGELLGLLADQAAIVLTNARLYAEAESATEQLAHRVEAQRTLGEIAASITSLRDPSAVLRRTVDEAKRLLSAEHVVIHQVRAGSRELADYREMLGGPDTPPVDEVTVSIGQGVAGRAVAEGVVTWTGDYLGDDSFEHTDRADDWIKRHDFHSQMSAPLVGETGPFGAITAYSSRGDAFDADDADLLGTLASHASIVLGNARLYEELERRVEAQRTLGEIAARITAIRDPGDVLQRTLDEAVRLLDADGGRIELMADEGGGLHWAFGHSAIDLPIERDEEIDPVELDEGVSGRAVMERRVIRTGDYLADTSFSHAEAPDRYIRQHGIRSVMSAPLIGEDGAIGSITVHSQARDAFDEANAGLLEVLASQAAIAVTNARLYEQLGEESAALARQTDSQRRLLQINERLLRTLDPESVLDLIADGLKSVVWYDNFSIYRVDDEMKVLNPVLARDRNAHAVLGFPIPRGSGLTWWSIEHREPVLLNDALHDPRVIQIPGTAEEEEAMVIVPLVSGDEVIGAMNIARTGGREVAFTDADFELVQLFAGQAAVAITNARLVEQLRTRVDAQRSLAEIAAQIASLHEPQTVLDRAVADAARLLKADRAQINLVSEGGGHLDPPITAAPIPPSGEDVVVPIGSGIAGMAAATKQVRWTGDYLADGAFPHDDGDAWIDAQGIHSMMAAPLLGPDRLIGTITIQATAPDAFDEADAELLKLLADQAAIALTNARLYAEVEESERRYRHLVDNSPDIVWEIDAEGRFTFFSDSLESRTGWKQEQLLGQPFTVLAGPTTLAEAAEAWRLLQEDPEREQRVRLDLPLPDGRIAKTEVAMTGTIVDGRFAGAHGSVRDISERERLEGDLRDQAAELAASQERAHLARELHDSVTQALFSMGLTLRTLELLLETDPEAARPKLVELRELQKDALAEMRTLIFELRPSSLENDGLVQALRTHATAVQRRTGLVVVVDAEPIERLPLSCEEALYRIGQEALHNVVKHANASNATIRIWREAEWVRLSVTDDGTGFDPDAVPRGHLGLIGMRQRVELVGGELRVQSRSGRGSMIEASVPAEPDTSAE
ncbi:MAG TPA: GAF domain-containing protein [Candidatus Limnocylindria bacterium]|nr:GAF domain-containing protein [Candidatus Limnocylindria bacterium]